MPDCGDSSCRYAKKRGGMRTNGGCRCDKCPGCGASIAPPNSPYHEHRQWCKMQAWIPPHHRGKMDVANHKTPTLNSPLTIQPLRPLLIMPTVKVVIDEEEE